jgi:3-phenylpropionate/cinnamic acid dioxygenase small subunit
MTTINLETLLVHHACTELIHQFAQLSDAGAFEQQAELFTPDGQFARPSQPNEFIRGQATILETFKSRPPRRTRHLISNIQITVTGPDSASATSSVSLYAAPAGSDVAVGPFLIGQYHDKFVRQGSDWRIHWRQGSVDLRIEH